MNKETSIIDEPVAANFDTRLSHAITELCETGNLALFLTMSITRLQESEHEVSLSFGEGAALVSLMQGLTDRIHNVTRQLSDLQSTKEVGNHG